MPTAPRVTVLYHYFHPDDVISARHFDGFCQDLAARGWRVTARPCNRGCRDESLTYPRTEDWDGVAIRRVWRPPLRQASTLGRLVNAGWMIAAWSLQALSRRPGTDVLVIGTDPILSVLVARAWRRLRPNVRIAHWAYDLYPEAPVADGMYRPDSRLVRALRWLLRGAYRDCDLIADLGSCMRERLAQYDHRRPAVTLVPWALAEPDRPAAVDPAVRRSLFGDAALGLLYSGNFGRAHGYAEFLDLARKLRGSPVHVGFAVRGNRVEELKKAVRPDDANVSFAGFAPEQELEARLGAADVHLVSLRPEWTGVVVPSKFFGCLAAGRPVLFAGSRDSAIARWIEEYRVGWVLTPDTLDAVAAELRDLSAAPGRLAELQTHCHAVYQAHFARRRVMDRWDRELRGLLPARPRAGVGGSDR